jgi:flagellar basal-body rod modification protein FlgD
MSSTISSINSTAAANSQSTANAITSATSQTLSEQDFLNLLVTQMTSQDPLNPETNQDLLSQMVGFSTLASNTTTQTDLGQMAGGQTFSEANSLIGSQVNLQTDSNGDTTQGIVSGVNTSSGTAQIVVNGQSYSLSQLLSVTPPSTSTLSTQ